MWRMSQKINKAHDLPAQAAHPTTGVRYPDLPDGRPQYGVRLNDDGNGQQDANGEDEAKAQ